MPPPEAGGGPANMGGTLRTALPTALRFGGAAFFLAIRPYFFFSFL
jgi:hypothetical protein